MTCPAYTSGKAHKAQYDQTFERPARNSDTELATKLRKRYLAKHYMVGVPPSSRLRKAYAANKKVLNPKGPRDVLKTVMDLSIIVQRQVDDLTQTLAYRFAIPLSVQGLPQSTCLIEFVVGVSPSFEILCFFHYRCWRLQSSREFCRVNVAVLCNS